MHGDLGLGFTRGRGVDHVDAPITQRADQGRRGAPACGGGVKSVVDDEYTPAIEDAGDDFC